MDKTNAFGNYLKRKFVEYFSPMYLNEHNEEPDDHDFADFLGLSDQAYSQYKLGKRRATTTVADQIADRLKDPRVYDVLGYPRRMPKDPFSIYFVEHAHELDEADKAEIKAIMERRIAEKEEKRRNSRNKPSYA